jgi:pyruvate dehydrogenase E2 component (dihydrolipoamide acetyltransferase)
MPTDVIMPQMGESIFEGTITKWLKQTGDRVEKDEPLFEISTDKVDAEIPAPVAGVLTEIKFPEGATVQVNTVVAVLSENGSAPGKTAKQNKSGASPVRAKEIPAQPAPSALPPERAERVETPVIAAPQAGTIPVVMPQMGESIFEGTITRWLKKAGDAVQKDEPLFEISTDKVDAEIPSPVDGVLTEIKFPEGATVQVNAVVAVLSSSASSAPKAASSAAPAPQAVEIQISSPSAHAPSQGGSQVRPRSSPLVRRIAKEHQIDLARVSGTGSNGRITKYDILGYLDLRRPDQPTAPAQQPDAVRAAASMAPRAQLSAASSPPQLKAEVVPLSKMRTLIAERMAESVRTIPHAHTVYKVDMTRIVRLRDRQRAAFEQRYGFKLTYMPFIAIAAIAALRQFPILNASLVEGGIQYHGSVHLGIAVALEWGLIVPVVRESEALDFLALARAINDLATRARAKKLMPDQVGGSTFTLTNPGIFGGEYGMPIINQPDSAILAIGGLRKEPVVLTDAEGNDTIAIRSVQYFCLGFDHRLIDGADSGKFMTAFKSALEAWEHAVP